MNAWPGFGWLMISQVISLMAPGPSTAAPRCRGAIAAGSPAGLRKILRCRRHRTQQHRARRDAAIDRLRRCSRNRRPCHRTTVRRCRRGATGSDGSGHRSTSMARARSGWCSIPAPTIPASPPHVAQSLGLPPDGSQPVMLRGVTGSAAVPTVQVDNSRREICVKAMSACRSSPTRWAAREGVLGTDGMQDRAYLHRLPATTTSASRAPRVKEPRPDFASYRSRTLRGNLLVVPAMVGNVRTKAIIDTGGQVTIANDGTAPGPGSQGSAIRGKSEPIEGVTADVQVADAMRTTPPLRCWASDRPGQLDRIPLSGCQLWRHAASSSIGD